MHKGDGHGPLADGRGEAFDRVVTHVASREHARHTRFQVIRLAIDFPIVATTAIAAKVRPGNKITLLIPDDPYLNGPIGVRHTTKTEKEKAGLDGSLVPGLPVSERDRSSMRSPCSALTSVLGRTSIFGVCLMRSTRYCDTLSFSRSPRITMMTFRA